MPSRTIRDNKEFTIIDGKFNFTTALSACIGLENNATLASIASLDEFRLAIELIDEVQAVQNDTNYFWIGYTRDPSSDSSAANFNYLDGTPNPFTEDRVFPWAYDEPNNSGSNQFCVVIGRGLAGTIKDTLDDFQCDGGSTVALGGALCIQSLSLSSLSETSTKIADMLITLGFAFFTLFVILFVLLLQKSNRRREINRTILQILVLDG